MKISPLILQPHHMDFFKNLFHELRKEGHTVGCLVRGDKINRRILSTSDLKYSFFGNEPRGHLPGFVTTTRNKMSLVSKLLVFKPDLILSVNSLPPSPFNSISSMKSIVFLDTKLRKKDERNLFNYADKIVTPDCYPFDVPTKKHLSHPSYHSLAYLHPNRFKPDHQVLEKLSIAKKDYVFVSFARKDRFDHKDNNLLQRREKIDIVRKLEEHCEVVVDGRGSVPRPLNECVPSISLDEYNHLLADAKLAVGDDPIISSEAGVLGVPWIFISNSTDPTLEEQEIQYEIGSRVPNIEEAEKLAEMILTEEIEPDIEQARKRILTDKIDLTKGMMKIVEVYDRTLER
ncbi:MAG: hypothetical protein KGY66_00085 [Candidatus Thermoplasmatota archaeon]|nr:hypothetical protein [Candidatus Thermoplasmatota archaeon]MBS3789301.1 hypothetical protein [Candidatus Thermoplasmatota archaeon]